MSTAAIIQSSKKALRQAVSHSLQSLSENEMRQQSEAVFKHIITSPCFQRSKTVSCYLSMKGEVDTTIIAHEIIRSGKALFIPKIVNRKESKMDFLRVYSIEDLESLPSGTWGIKEPAPDFEGRRRASVFDTDADPIDLILMPGVAFDSAFSRLGHGKGYYDFFINTYTNSRPCPALYALSLKEQFLPLDEIPMAVHDRKMDAIVSPDGILLRDKL